MPHHKLLLSARGDDHCHRRPAEGGQWPTNGQPLPSRGGGQRPTTGQPWDLSGRRRDADGHVRLRCGEVAMPAPKRNQTTAVGPPSACPSAIPSPPRARAFKSPDAGASMPSVSSAQASTRPGLKRTTTAWKLSSKKKGGSEAAAQARPRRRPAGRGRHRLPRAGQRRATARCLPWLKILWAPAGNVPAAKARQTRVDFNAAAWIMVSSMTYSINFLKNIYTSFFFFYKLPLSRR